MAPVTDAQMTKKTRRSLRAGGLHVKTGCKTCKVRHIKCDEEKPACANCKKTGRICDGYAHQKGIDPTAVPSLLYQKILDQALAAISNLHPDFLQNAKERRCYDYFHSNARPVINFAFGSSLRVQQLILQASHSNGSTKHTVLALGSITEYLNEAKILSQNVSHDTGRLRYAHGQYIKAICELQKELSVTHNPPTELVLTSCLLLSLFDFLGGEDSNARVHLTAGIDILRRCYPTELNELTSPGLQKNQQPNLMVQDFARIFSVMDLHAAFWLGLSTCYTLPMEPYPLLDKTLLIPGATPDLDKISLILNCQLGRANAFFHDNTPRYPSPSAFNVPFHIQAEKQRILYELEQWPSILTNFLSRTPQPTRLESDRIAIMRMQYLALHIRINTFLSPPLPAIYLPFTSAFSSILADAKAVLQFTPSKLPTPPPETAQPPLIRENVLQAIAANCGEEDALNMSFLSFVAGLIQPLYFTATKCQDARMCRDAIAMLEETPWREGAWDSSLMGRIARRELEGRAKESDVQEIA
ncbi:uncharacterized protein KY384_005174 [Bacidia gigantensis]|uniref:uncharacterized protein n=1 Tax=Bacidia gigantensis TaxID=2732470 RepID=UPI001D05B4CB|nr:uncharacterized protein KY384_005174 [Bacidia gigantensis]KAG8529693.1 hypothetical protein KY384_005174 [Bacidia gigantensis]